MGRERSRSRINQIVAARVHRILRIALLVQSCGCWIIPLAWILLAIYSRIGGSGLAYLLFGWPSLGLGLLGEILALLGFYAIGVVLFVIALAVSIVTKERQIIVPTLIYLLSVLIMLGLNWYYMRTYITATRMLWKTFLPWFG